jgi:hypothetical protein
MEKSSNFMLCLRIQISTLGQAWLLLTRTVAPTASTAALAAPVVLWRLSLPPQPIKSLPTATARSVQAPITHTVVLQKMLHVVEGAIFSRESFCFLLSSSGLTKESK